MRSVERIELPSTRELMICACLSKDNRFISPSLFLSVLHNAVRVKKNIDLYLKMQYISSMATDKTQVIQVRVTPEEKAGMAEAASLAGIALSSWVRERLRLAAIHELEMAGRRIPFIAPVPLGGPNE
jgi:hypothetical protein